MPHVSAEELQAGFEEIRSSPGTEGRVELIVCRPAENERRVLEEGELDPATGLVGDRFSGAADRQLTLMNARVIGLVARERRRWPLAGDQLYVDLDLSPENLPAGTRLAVGSAVIEVTEELHTGCSKFTERFGSAAIRFVNSREGRALRMRGLYARVVEAGRVRRGDAVRKLQEGLVERRSSPGRDARSEASTQGAPVPGRYGGD
jgi:MOSC domain-containing protein YiiM